MFKGNYMKIREIQRVRNILIYLVIATLWIASSSYAALADPVGKFTIINGRVDVLKYGKGRAVPAKLGDGVFLGDVVRTKSKSKARIVFIDDTVLNLAENSRVEVKDFMFAPEKNRRLNILRSFRGLVRATTPPSSPGATPHLRIETPTSIAAVRGTDFFVLVHGTDATSVIVIDGFVGVSNTDPYVAGKVVVGPSQMTTVGTGQPPAPPRTVTPGEMSTLIEATAADPDLVEEPSVEDTGGVEETEEGSGSQEGTDPPPEEGGDPPPEEGGDPPPEEGGEAAAVPASLTGGDDTTETATEEDIFGFSLPEEPPVEDAPLLEPEPIVETTIESFSEPLPVVIIPDTTTATTTEPPVVIPITETIPEIIPAGATTPININISFD